MTVLRVDRGPGPGVHTVTLGPEHEPRTFDGPVRRFFDWRRVPGSRELPRVDGPAFRAQLIARGAIAPLEARPTLRMDDVGRAAAARAIAEYERHPERADDPYHPEPPPGDWSHLPDED